MTPNDAGRGSTHTVPDKKTPSPPEENVVLQFFPKLSSPETLSRRIVRTYAGLLVGPLLGFGVAVAVAAVIAASASTWAALAFIFLLGLICLLCGWGLGPWHSHRLGLGQFTVYCAALLPILVLVVGAALQSWLSVLALAVTLPLVVALLGHGRRRDGTIAGLAVVALVAGAFLGWVPIDGGRAVERTADDLQALDLQLYGPHRSTGLEATNLQIAEDGLTYDVVEDGTTHSVALERRPPTTGEPIEGLEEGRTPEGAALRYDEGTLITVRSRDEAGEDDPAAATAFADDLTEQTGRSFAMHADL